MPEAQVVNCNSCGGSLDIADDTRFLTCRYCASQLKVCRGDHDVHTAVIADLRMENASLRAQLEVAELRRELDQLENNWQACRKSFLTIDRSNFEREPSEGDATSRLLLGLFLGAFAVAFSSLAMHAGEAPVTFPIFVFLVCAAITLTYANTARKTYKAYNSARQAYVARRSAIYSRITELAGEPAFQVIDDTSTP